MPAGMKRMAPEDSPQAKIGTLAGAISFHRLIGIFGAGGQKTAVPAEQGRKRQFVALDQQQQDLFHFICT